jgi:integrase
MARTLRDSRLDTREQRLNKLKVRGKPYWRQIEPGLHLGYRRLADQSGTWCVRRYVGGQSYKVEALDAVADDHSDADGHAVLTFAQAQRAALARKPKVGPGALTVARALEQYLESLTDSGKPTQDAKYRIDALIVPKVGTVPVEALTSEQIRAWHAALAKSPGRRTQKDDNEAPRRRRVSANRTLTILKAALNHAYREGTTPTDAAWRRVRPFQGVDAARVRYLSVDEAQRLVNASHDPDFRKLVQAALATGCRYGELGRMVVRDFNRDSGTVEVRQSKSGKPRHVVLNNEAVALFRQWAAGKPGGALLFTRHGGKPWRKGDQDRPMWLACERAKLDPPANFHALRHSYASLAIMAGAPLMVVAKNLGHRDTRMCELHYGHLAASFVADAIRAAAPQFGFKADDTVVPLVRP